jgi:Leucine-rich repeat (LRR) protein
MKIQVKIILCFIALFSSFTLLSQNTEDSTLKNKTYSNLEEALKNADNVYRLDLSNQSPKLPADSVWFRFKNLEFLSLKNDHLKEIPSGLGYLKNLKTLDLSGNDFKILPNSFSNLTNLRELYLNDEKKMDVNQSLIVIRDLPKLSILHLENDNLKSIPPNIFLMRNLETLYLNDNRISSIPQDFKKLDNLKYLDLQHNKLKPASQDMMSPSHGFKIRF